MLILKYYYTDELCEIKISEDIEKVKKHTKEKFDGIHENIEYQQIENVTFIIADTEEIGVIGPVEEL